MPPKKSSLGKKTKGSLVQQSLRSQETPQEREFRLTNERNRASTSRAAETLEHYNARLGTQRVFASTSRINETPNKENERLSKQRIRSSRLRAQEAPEQRQIRLQSQQIRSSRLRAHEAPEQRQVRLQNQQITSSTLRAQETPEQHQIRLSNQYDRTLRLRSIETTAQHDLRLSSQRSRSSSVRANEVQSEREGRLRNGRLRVANVRSNETPEDRDRRLRNERSRVAQMRDYETLEERNVHRIYNQRRIQNRLNVYERIAFNYDPNMDYTDDDLVSIGQMDNVCNYCNALKYKNEPPGICCGNGKIVLPELQPPPQPLLSLVSGTTSEFKHFLSNIRKYNSCFQMTSFGATNVVREHFMPTFRVQGQIYHRMRSLLPTRDHKYLQIYFMGQADDLDQVQQRRQYNPETREQTVAELQLMLHENNELVRTFKKANNDLQLLPNHQVVIHADKIPAGEHQGRYNAPTANDVAILMVGNPVAHRDIIVRRYDDRVNRISETHRSYDALQYPVIFPYGDDGYHFEIRQINPVTIPPSAPVISVIGTTTNSVSLQWKVDDIGGAPLRGFTLTYRKEFGDWEEIQLDRRVNSHLLEGLQCGTRYQFTLVTFNKIGTSATSSIEVGKTKGNKPVAPTKHSLIRPNITSALIELSSWQDGGCPIQYFSIEFKRYGISSDWIIVSSRIETHTRYTIGDLESGTIYNLRVTAHNNAGSTIKEYTFETLRFSGMSRDLDQSDLPQVNSLFRDAHLIAVIITSVFGTILALIGACICFKNYPRHIFSRNVDTLRPPGNEGKDLQHREQYYEHENQSANIPLNRKGMQPAMYDPRSGDDNTLSNTGMKVKRSVSGSGNISMGGGECSHTSTEKRHKRRSKTIKSESEEYDSLNSDSDLSGERIRDDNRSTRTDASSQMDNSAYNIHGHSPRSGSSNKERLSVFSRPQLHSNSVDAVPLDYRLFDPPPKQRKQQQSTNGKASSPKYHQRQASDECAKNSTNNTNLSGSISGKVRSKAADNNSNSGNSLAGEFQCASNSIPSPHIVQSGSYVEILKQATNSTPPQAMPSHERLASHNKGSINSASSLACHNKSYGDFLTITPRRKGKQLSAEHKTAMGEGHDNYRHHLPHSIEPLHLLGIPNDNMSTFFDYRAMETLSNADTLAIGSTMAGHLYPSKGSKQSIQGSGPVSTDRQVPDEFHHIISEKNLSPPSAFCDNISSLNKA